MTLSDEIQEASYATVKVSMKPFTPLFLPLNFAFCSFHYSALATHWAQWSWSGVQGELQETGLGWGLEGTHGEKTLVCGEEDSHFCALWDQDPSQEPSGLGPGAQDRDWLLRRGLWVVVFVDLMWFYLKLQYFIFFILAMDQRTVKGVAHSDKAAKKYHPAPLLSTSFPASASSSDYTCPADKGRDRLVNMLEQLLKNEKKKIKSS